MAELWTCDIRFELRNRDSLHPPSFFIPSNSAVCQRSCAISRRVRLQLDTHLSLSLPLSVSLSLSVPCRRNFSLYLHNLDSSINVACTRGRAHEHKVIAGSRPGEHAYGFATWERSSSPEREREREPDGPLPRAVYPRLADYGLKFSLAKHFAW